MSLTGLKRTTAFGAGFGVAAAITVVAIIGGLYWYQSRPKPWRTNAIVGSSGTASQTFQYHRDSREMRPVGFSFRFVVENKTGQDYTVPQELKLFKRDKETGALAEFSGKLDHGYAIPA